MSFEAGAEILGMNQAGQMVISGDDVGDELTGMLRDAPGMTLRDKAAEALAKDAVVYRPTKYKRARRLPIGFASNVSSQIAGAIPIPGTNFVLVPAGATFSVIATPQRPFRGGRLVVPSDVAGGFILNEMKVQGQNQNPLGDQMNVPTRALQENAEAVVFHLDTADTNSQIALSLTNISGGPLFFSAMLLGVALYE